MTDSQYTDSVKLFFDSFGKHLKRIRDDGKDANQAYRAQILLGQLIQFEKAILEYQGASVTRGMESRVLRSLMRIADMDSLVKWLVEEQQTAPLAGLFYLDSAGHWTRLHGETDLPRKMRIDHWHQHGLLGRLAEEGRHYLAYVHGQPRLLLSIEEPPALDEEELHAFLAFLCRLLPLFLTGRIKEPPQIDGAKDDIVANDIAFLELLTLIERVAAKDVTVLLEGESGTGKEVIANFVCRNSSRANKPFVAVNCAAIPAGLIESELFGHEKGAFTGAHQRKIGRLEEAQGGTLFLDEIGELELAMQAKLLRFLQLHELHRVGGRQKISVDVRIIAATNRDLKKCVSEGEFREDLYYRLSVAPFRVPALRERVGDILPLTEFFIQKYAREFNMPIPEVSGSVYQLLASYTFPGNVRELENLVQNVLVTSQGESILPAHLPAEIQSLEPKAVPVVDKRGAPITWKRRRPPKQKIRLKRRTIDAMQEPAVQTFSWTRKPPTDNDELKAAKQEIQDWARQQTLELERKFLEDLLERAGGSMPQASKMSNINRTLLYKMLERTKN
ncbi:MAG: sigma-54 dependent transcriptional regulator [Acidobacteriota bacterium]|nr:sigma-54 dependent transcriptional regulator [Acidobacteriota bacterium]